MSPHPDEDKVPNDLDALLHTAPTSVVAAASVDAAVATSVRGDESTNQKSTDRMAQTKVKNAAAAPSTRRAPFRTAPELDEQMTREKSKITQGRVGKEVFARATQRTYTGKYSENPNAVVPDANIAAAVPHAKVASIKNNADDPVRIGKKGLKQGSKDLARARRRSTVSELDAQMTNENKKAKQGDGGVVARVRASVVRNISGLRGTQMSYEKNRVKQVRGSSGAPARATGGITSKELDEQMTKEKNKGKQDGMGAVRVSTVQRAGVIVASVKTPPIAILKNAESNTDSPQKQDPIIGDRIIEKNKSKRDDVGAVLSTSLRAAVGNNPALETGSESHPLDTVVDTNSAQVAYAKSKHTLGVVPVPDKVEDDDEWSNVDQPVDGAFQMPGAFAVGDDDDDDDDDGSDTFGKSDATLDLAVSTKIDFYEHVAHAEAENQMSTALGYDSGAGLITASLVDNTTIVEAEAVSEDYLRRKRRKRRLGFYFALIVLTVIIVVSTTLTQKTVRGDTLSPTTYPSSSPSTSPSESPSSAPTSSVRIFLEGVEGFLSETSKAFDDEFTPQARALMWLENNNTHIFGALTEQRRVQRFVMATLFYSTLGEQWAVNRDWLSNKTECTWFSTLENEENPSLPDADKICPGGDTLRRLELTFNRLQGPLPPELALLSNLEHLVLSKNFLVSTLPTEIGSMSTIQMIDLEDNALDGSLPSELGLLSTLTALKLSSNAITGSIPTTLGQISKLQSLEMNENELDEKIPTEIGLLLEMKFLALKDNRLKGSIPTEFGTMRVLEVLELDRNVLSGPILSTANLPDVFPFPSLERLGVSLNYFTGTLPNWVGRISSLTYLNFASNGLSGTIPSEIGLLNKLETMDFASTGFSGSMPSEIGLLSSLVLFRTTSNLVGDKARISGSIPTEFGRLTRLETLELQRSSFTGAELPSEMGSIKTLRMLDLDYTKIGGTLPTEFGLLTSLEEFSLAQNNMVGTIPTEFGLMQSLKLVQFSQNQLTGTLPTELGLLDRLERIMFYSNALLKGTIPSELSSIRNMGKCNVFASKNAWRILAIFVILVVTLVLLFNLFSLLSRPSRNLSNTEVLFLRQTNLTGMVPKGVCELRSRNLINIDIDCGRVECSCCFDRCFAPTTPAPKGCPVDQVAVQISVTTDQQPQETTWDIFSEASNEILLQGGPYSEIEVFTTFIDETCVPAEECSILIIRDSQEDGMCCGVREKLSETEIGSVGYRVHYDGEEIFSGGRFTANETVGMGSCAPTSVPTTTPAPTGTLCSVCEDGSPPLNGDLVIDPVFGSNCTVYNARLANETDPIRCAAGQLIYGKLCGCKNPIVEAEGPRGTGACSICAGTGNAYDPFAKPVGLGGTTCYGLEWQANFFNECLFFQDFLKASICCPKACSISEPCSTGYFCNIKNGEGGVCESCGECGPASSCSACNDRDGTECASACKPLECDTGFSPFRLEVRTELFPIGQSTWSLVDTDTSENLLGGGNFTEGLTTIVDETCIKSGACLKFSLVNPGADIMGYTAYFNGRKVGSRFGEDCPLTLAPSISPSRTPSLKPSVFECPIGFSLLSTNFTAESNPGNTVRTFIVDDGGEVLLRGGPYEEGMAYEDEACLATDACVTLSINDLSIVDTDYGLKMSYSLSLDEVEVAFGSYFGKSLSVQIGSCTQPQS